MLAQLVRVVLHKDQDRWCMWTWFHCWGPQFQLPWPVGSTMCLCDQDPTEPHNLRLELDFPGQKHFIHTPLGKEFHEWHWMRKEAYACLLLCLTSYLCSLLLLLCVLCCNNSYLWLLSFCWVCKSWQPLRLFHMWKCFTHYLLVIFKNFLLAFLWDFFVLVQLLF